MTEPPSTRPPEPGPGPGSPPCSLRELIPWFEEFSRGLVRLSDPSIGEIRAAIDALEEALRVDLAAHRAPRDGAGDAVRWREAFLQLRWLLGILEREDHGGHRQALGQYGLLVAESLRSHLFPVDGRGTPAAPPPPGQDRGDPPGRLAGRREGGKLMRMAEPGAPS